MYNALASPAHANFHRLPGSAFSFLIITVIDLRAERLTFCTHFIASRLAALSFLRGTDLWMRPSIESLIQCGAPLALS